MKKVEKRAQLGEIQRTSIAMPLDIPGGRGAAARWIMEAVQQRLEREAS